MATSYPAEVYGLLSQVGAGKFPGGFPLLGLNAQATNQISFQTPYELLGIHMAVTLLNVGAACMGAVVLLGINQPTVNFGLTTPALIQALSLQNSAAASAPFDFSVSRTFRSPIPIAPGKLISLYVCGDNTAGNLLYAAVSLDVRRTA